ncbi:MAG: rhodanese-like domain-containing protein [Rubrivivax sp.]|nr:MAG: rhodanese-like domain-containing protein [Rubrivivax sp.]
MNLQIQHYQNKLAHEIDSWDVHEAQKAGADIVVIDARSRESFDKGHILGAISLPHKTMTLEGTAHLDKSSLYAVYCDGLGCNASTAGALKMARLGFRVRELIGGLQWWREHGYPVQSGAGGASGQAQEAASSVACDCA